MMRAKRQEIRRLIRQQYPDCEYLHDKWHGPQWRECSALQRKLEREAGLRAQYEKGKSRRAPPPEKHRELSLLNAALRRDR